MYKGKCRYAEVQRSHFSFALDDRSGQCKIGLKRSSFSPRVAVRAGGLAESSGCSAERRDIWLESSGGCRSALREVNGLASLHGYYHHDTYKNKPFQVLQIFGISFPFSSGRSPSLLIRAYSFLYFHRNIRRTPNAARHEIILTMQMMLLSASGYVSKYR